MMPPLQLTDRLRLPLQAAAQIFGASNLVKCAWEIEGFAHHEQFNERKARIPILRQRTHQLIAELALAERF